MSEQTPEHRILIAGFGGQGILTLGKILCNAAINEGLRTTYMPSYGTEVRGGTCNCHVVISDNEIFSPYVERAQSLIILNEPSLQRFQPMLRPGGLLVCDSSMVETEPQNNGDPTVAVAVPATDIAAELGNVLVANVILLGTFISMTQLCRPSTIEQAIKEWLSSRKKDAIPVNITAFHRGLELADGE
ncbi:MAG: 2-oxoacid:acceptor oxidoreductase family protein [Planctomycetota bacterium]